MFILQLIPYALIVYFTGMPDPAAGPASQAAWRPLSPDPPLVQPPGDKWFCGCQTCIGKGHMFVSRATWIRHEEVREDGIARRISRPPHPSYPQPVRKRPRGEQSIQVPSHSTSRGADGGPPDKRMRLGTGIPIAGRSQNTQVSTFTRIQVVEL